MVQPQALIGWLVFRSLCWVLNKVSDSDLAFLKQELLKLWALGVDLHHPTEQGSTLWSDVESLLMEHRGVSEMAPWYSEYEAMELGALSERHQNASETNLFSKS